MWSEYSRRSDERFYQGPWYFGEFVLRGADGQYRSYHLGGIDSMTKGPCDSLDNGLGRVTSKARRLC